MLTSGGHRYHLFAHEFLPFVINPEKLVLWVGTNLFFILKMGDGGSHSTLNAVKRITEAYKKL